MRKYLAKDKIVTAFENGVVFKSHNSRTRETNTVEIETTTEACKAIAVLQSYIEYQENLLKEEQ